MPKRREEIGGRVQTQLSRFTIVMRFPEKVGVDRSKVVASRRQRHLQCSLQYRLDQAAATLTKGKQVCS